MSHTGQRRAGVLVPLFSCPSTASWGIGDIGDVEPMTRWLASAGQCVLQLLPLSEMAPGQQSPYSAMSAMAIDPIYIRLAGVPDFAALGGEALLGAEDRARLDRVRRAPRIEYADVRRLKRAALGAAFERFVDAEWCRDTERARALKGFLGEQAWWIDDYALFRAIHAREGERSWFEWPEALKQRDPAAIQEARSELSRDVLFYQYVQWIADRQWREARAHTNGVALYGDLAFMVDGDSADVWARQSQFSLDASAGVPPDPFSATGQDWGMPVYRWEVVAGDDFQWLRERARRSADLYDGYRIDHLVGFYRTYGRPRDGGAPFFTPATEAEQTALGERVLAILREPGSDVIAEDLGVIPDFVRASLARLGVPGFRVFRWERQWQVEGQPFLDPSEYPAASVATSGTHDTETLVVWWERASDEERVSVNTLPTIQLLTGGAGLENLAGALCTPAVRDTLVEALVASGSDLVLVPIQDVFGWRDRINTPARVSGEDWRFRLPWPCDRLDEVPEARERRDTLRAWTEKYSRR